MKKRIFKGVGTAVITPFKNEKIDFDTYFKLIEFQISSGINAIVVCGTTGEASTLTDDEHRKMIDTTVERVNGRTKVIAGTGSNDTEYTVELSRYASNAGVDGILQVTPYYNKASQKGLIQHFLKVADAVDVPVILYNVPSRTNLNILPATYKELAKHENIVATKEAGGNMAAIGRTMALCGDDLEFYSGNDSDIVPILSLGGIGVISTFANIMPKEAVEMCNLYFEGNITESAKRQIKYSDIIDALFCEVNPIPLKAAVSLMGLADGELRLPLSEMDEKNKDILIAAMKVHNLI